MGLGSTPYANLASSFFAAETPGVPAGVDDATRRRTRRDRLSAVKTTRVDRGGGAAARSEGAASGAWSGASTGASTGALSGTVARGDASPPLRISTCGFIPAMRRARADAASPPPYAAARRFARIGASLRARSNAGGSGRSGGAGAETAAPAGSTWSSSAAARRFRSRPAPGSPLANFARSSASLSTNAGFPAYADSASSFFSSVFLRRSCNFLSIAAARPTAPPSGRASRGGDGTFGASGADARNRAILGDSIADASTARATASRTASTSRSARGVLLSSFAASLNLRTTSYARARGDPSPSDANDSTGIFSSSSSSGIPSSRGVTWPDDLASTSDSSGTSSAGAASSSSTRGDGTDGDSGGRDSSRVGGGPGRGEMSRSAASRALRTNREAMTTRRAWDLKPGRDGDAGGRGTRRSASESSVGRGSSSSPSAVSWVAAPSARHLWTARRALIFGFP